MHLGSKDCLVRFLNEGAEHYDAERGPRALEAARQLADVLDEASEAS